MEIFPSIEVIDRTYAPADQQVRFAIPVEIAQQDIDLALQGKFVTRVIYLEDPHNALPMRSGRRPVVVRRRAGPRSAGGGRRVGPAGGDPPPGRPRAGPGTGPQLLLWLAGLGGVSAAHGLAIQARPRGPHCPYGRTRGKEAAAMKQAQK